MACRALVYIRGSCFVSISLLTLLSLFQNPPIKNSHITVPKCTHRGNKTYSSWQQNKLYPWYQNLPIMASKTYQPLYPKVPIMVQKAFLSWHQSPPIMASLFIMLPKSTHHGTQTYLSQYPNLPTMVSIPIYHGTKTYLSITSFVWMWIIKENTCKSAPLLRNFFLRACKCKQTFWSYLVGALSPVNHRGLH